LLTQSLRDVKVSSARELNVSQSVVNQQTTSLKEAPGVNWGDFILEYLPARGETIVQSQ